MSVLDGEWSLEIDENADGARWTVVTQRAPSQRFPSVLIHTMYRSFCALPAFVGVPSPFSCKFLPPFCQPKRSITDRVQIFYRSCTVLSYSSYAHMSSTDMEQTEEPVDVYPECMVTALQNEVDKNYLAMYLYMKNMKDPALDAASPLVWFVK